MDIKIEYKSSSTLKLPSNELDSIITNKPSKNISSPQEIPKEIKSDTIQPIPIPALSFNAIYKELHSKFPETINLDKPVLLAVGIRKQMSKETGISSVILKKWTSWYFRKSKYYTQHKEGAMRYNLDGTEAGAVTEKQQEKMIAYFERINARKSESADNKSKDSDK